VNQNWQDQAACRGRGEERPALFWGPEYEVKTDRERREARAKAVCKSCPVRSECLEYALAGGERDCVYGGMNYDERQAERRRRRERKRAAA
jgi:WhiB family redox-sensing transcriptional regulator